ncbi:MAG TPA: phage head morphogenesis protein, partial [Acidiferrobacteraceae bacterium]|nr:phage head morphogenesis protein [Acidiferrobacteraceae bacterium]
MPEPQLGAVPFNEAIEFFRRKLNIPTDVWQDMLRGEHAKAFTVAGATKADLLSDLRGEIDQAIMSVTTLGDFRKNFDQIVAKHGWDFKGSPAWRTRTIFNTNLRTAAMAGRWEQIQRVKKTRPYLIYETVGDLRVRPEHAAWDQIVLPVDDPWWDTHYPPNGWGCRCHVRSANKRQLKQEGIKLGKAPKTTMVNQLDRSTGELVPTPNGIDLGWDYNIGKAYLGPDAAFGRRVMQLPAKTRDAAL